MRFEQPQDRDRAATVEVAILRGGCSGGGLAEYKELLGRGERPRHAPEPLRPGRYGFRARARDGSCRIVAEGCTAVSLPTEQTIVVVLQSGSSVPEACPAAQCDGAGRCPGERGYAGAVPRHDGGSGRDATAPPGPDAATGCGPCAAPTASGGCEGASFEGHACSEGGSTGVCRSGACCTGCVDGTGACVAGDSDAACGQGGFSCRRCGPCERCGADGRYEPRADSTPCTVDGGTSGKCLSGTCCTGCLLRRDGGAAMCIPPGAQSYDACGLGGSACSACGGLDLCCHGVCQGSCS